MLNEDVLYTCIPKHTLRISGAASICWLPCTQPDRQAFPRGRHCPWLITAPGPCSAWPIHTPCPALVPASLVAGAEQNLFMHFTSSLCSRALCDMVGRGRRQPAPLPAWLCSRGDQLSLPCALGAQVLTKSRAPSALARAMPREVCTPRQRGCGVAMCLQPFQTALPKAGTRRLP